MPSQNDINWLKRRGFPYATFSRLGNLLIANREITEELIRASGEHAGFVFEDGLPTVAKAGLVKNIDDLRVLVELAHASEINFVRMLVMLECGSPELINIIKSLIKNADDLRSVGLIFIEIYDASTQYSGHNLGRVLNEGLPIIFKVGLIKKANDLRVLVELVHALGDNIMPVLENALPAAVKAGMIKNADDLRSIGLILAEFICISKKENVSSFIGGFCNVVETGLIKNSDDLRVLVELARVLKDKIVPVLHITGLPKIAGLIKTTNDWRVLVEIARASGDYFILVLEYGLPTVIKLGLIKNSNDLRVVGLVLAELARASGDYFIWVLEYGLPVVVKAGLVKNADDLRVVGMFLADLAVLSGKKYVELFFNNNKLLLWYFKERTQGRKPRLQELILIANRLKFPGYGDELYKKMDPRLALTKNAKLAKELLDIAQSGRSDYKKWYEKFNAERIKTMADYGIDVGLWLGKKRFVFKDVSISVVSVESEKIVQELLPQLRSWLEVLLGTVNDSQFVLGEMVRRLPKQPREVSVEAVVELLQSSPKAIPAFIQDVVFKVVKEKPDVSCIPEKDLRKLVTGFYGKAIAVHKARKEKEEAEVVQNELVVVSKLSYERLVENLPKLKVMPYLQTRLKEFMRASPKAGKEADCSRALHELERISQAIINLVSAEDKEQKTHFEGTYDLRFRVSDKFPTEVLTIGNDGHACIQAGGEYEPAGHNFYRDVDALFVEILSMSEEKKSFFRVFKSFDRVGFALVFAAVDSQNRPVLALNTVELPKLWPAKVQAKFFDAMVDWLKIFASKAGFRAIMIGNGYGSEYFTNKYGAQNVYFKKMSPYPTKIKYYTNAFEHGTTRETPEGLVLEYSGTGAIIWER